MLWPGTKHASMNFKEKYRKYRVVPLRARLRPG